MITTFKMTSQSLYIYTHEFDTTKYRRLLNMKLQPSDRKKILTETSRRYDFSSLYQ